MRQSRPGIEAMEVYFPAQFVEQSALEEANGISKGKYTIGLGQLQMAFCTDLENVHTLALTVVSNLMEKTGTDYNDIGRMTVSSETIIDKSKSIKSVLMQLFEESGNHDVEGVDYLNACYAGTAGLFDAISWMESEDWDGRRAIVVCADIAEYEEGPARPTGGAGAVAMLIGPDPVIELGRGRASYMKNAYDFYKPYLSSPYPVVDGKLSNACYLEAVDECFQRLARIRNQRYQQETHLDDWDYCIFHSPYNKLVQKSFGRLMYNDFLLHPEKPEYAELQQFLELDPKETYSDRTLYKAFAKASKQGYDEKVAASTHLPKTLGNAYTASLYLALASLIGESEPEDLVGRDVLAFSYGSGLCSSLFQLHFTNSLERINEIQRVVNYRHRLNDRQEHAPESYTKVLNDKQAINEFEDFVPQHMVSNLYPGTFHVVHRLSTGKHEYSMHDGAYDKCVEQ